MTRRCLCLYGHFYQPPRENPWLEEVEVQDSASPFHDWNERITAECYSPNSAARIKTPQGRICDIGNNYEQLSFDFGPTLLSWLERANPIAYSRILGADAASVARAGQGNALAAAYSHPILPLCSPRDRRTSILWGKADFLYRFGREPLGFWLPETAADTQTLKELALQGFRFTVLSPYQALRVRPAGGTWHDASGGQFDPTRPYRVSLGDSLAITVFFYDGPISRAFAFEGGLVNAEDTLRKIESGFDASRDHDELLTIAIDGETFGHHKKGGDETLAVTLRLLSNRSDIELINLGQALETFPVEWEAEIAEGSSWSCAHGLERWKSDCGCQANGQPGWKQAWRAPLRETLDLLREHLIEIFEREGRKLLRDPWQAREDYVEVVLDRDRKNALEFLGRHALRPLEQAEVIQALKLLEMQRHAQLMYTSCGWFFSEISGIETAQILKYAARAIQLARDVTGVDLEPIVKEGLSRAPSNLPEYRDGAVVWDQCVKPSVVSLEGVAAHHVITSLFEPSERTGRLFCYRYANKDQRKEVAGPATLAVGRIELESLTTRERLDESYCVLHFGGSDFRCGLLPFTEESLHAEMVRSLFSRISSLTQVLREIDRIFVGRDYTLRDLFLDERRQIASLLLHESMRRYESAYTEIFDSNRRIMEFLREIDSPIPLELRVAADVALTQRMQQLSAALVDERRDLASIHSELLRICKLARRIGARIDVQGSRPFFEKAIRDRLARLDSPGRKDPAFEIVELIELARGLGLKLDLYSAQNRFWARVRDRGAPPLERDTVAKLADKLWFDPPTLEALAVREQSEAPAASAAPASPPVS
jgi:alpha-amylase/alpha-mannosidase (GH57 family)